MLDLKAFISLEKSMAATVAAPYRKLASTLESTLYPLIENGDWNAAYDVIAVMSLDGLANDRRSRLEELAVSSLIFGAQLVSGRPSNTSFATGEASIPMELQNALDQFAFGIEDQGAQTLRDQLFAMVRAEQEREIKKVDQTLAQRLNNAVVGNGKAVIDIGANLTTSRLVSLGFLSEAITNKLTTYQVNEVLDSRICPVCEYLHGKTFQVSQEFSQLITVLNVSDPKELRSLAPFPSQSKTGKASLNDLSLAELQSHGYGSPPYHPGCRGVLGVTGTVTEKVKLGKMIVVAPKPAAVSDMVPLLPDGSKIEFGAWEGKTELNDDFQDVWVDPSPLARYVIEKVNALPSLTGANAGLKKNPLPQVDYQHLSDVHAAVLGAKQWALVDVAPSQLVSAQEWVKPDNLVHMTSVVPETLTIEERYPTAVARSDGTYRIIDGNHRSVLAFLLGMPLKVRLLGNE